MLFRSKALRNALSSKASAVKASFIGNAYYHGRAISVSNDSDGADVTLNNTFVWNNSAGDETTCAPVDPTDFPVGTKDFTGAEAIGQYTLSCEVWVDGEFGNGSGAAIYAPEKGTDVHVNSSLVALNVAQGSAAIVADSVDISNQSFAFYNFSRNNQDAPIVNAGSVVLALNEVHVSDSLIADNANLGVADANRGLDEPVGGAIAVAGRDLRHRTGRGRTRLRGGERRGR